MSDIPGWPSLNVTDDHKAAAADLLKSIKDANPQHEGIFKKIESGAIHMTDGVVEGAGDAADAVAMPLLILTALACGRPLFGD